MGVIGPLICYEDAFPEISRELTRNGANMLVNLTNDAWYGVSSAPYQHLAIAIFRAVENRRYMIRATNTGVSAIIAPTGEVLMDSPLFERLALVGKIFPREDRSFYTENGDWFAYACIAYTAIGAIIALVLSVRSRRRATRT
jgi:apolipoprotein N-acyltransferase